jgi:hypothetical protein
MKLTEAALRKIIKEEVGKAIRENEDQSQSDLKGEIMSAFQKIVSLDTKIAKQYGKEYSDLSQRFHEYYNTDIINLKGVENNELVPVAAAVSWYKRVSGRN